MIVVTGGAGFIGSQLVKGLNGLGYEDILVVDDLRDGKKFVNLVACRIADYMDRYEFRNLLTNSPRRLPPIEHVFHQGACTVTTEWDGRYMLENNYSYSKDLARFCLQRRVPMVYASSASVYGVQRRFAEREENEVPVNVYGYSKLLFDNWVRKQLAAAESQITGLRYFNVYGPGEQHKGAMASIIYQLNRQLLESDTIKLFRGSHGFDDGEQRRDFIAVDDVVAINLWLLRAQRISGVFNVGTGSSHTFNQVARHVIDWHGHGTVEYIEFPERLRDFYQAFTEADMSLLRSAGYEREFVDLETGINAYLQSIDDTRANPHAAS